MADESKDSTGTAGPGGATADAGTGTLIGSDGTLNDYFQSLPLSLFELPPGGHVVVIPSDATIQEAVLTLSKHNILAAPVRDVACTSPNPQWHELFLGLFSMTDAVFAALKMEEIAGKPARGTGAGGATAESADDEVSPKTLFRMMATKRYFTTAKVTEVLHTFKFGPFVPLEEDDSTSVLDAALILGKYRQHRVVVVQPTVGERSEETAADLVAPDRRLRNIITQSAIVRFLCREDVATKLHPIANKTLADLGLSAKRSGVVSVGLDDPAAVAFARMHEEGVSAVAVVASDGRLVGCVSNRDARVIATARHSLSILRGPVRVLLRVAHDTLPDIAHPSIQVKASDTLATAMRHLDASRIHRVFVVDEDNKPIGVVSLSDVLNALVMEPRPDYFGSFFDATVDAS